MSIKRNQIIYLITVILTMTLGLLSRKFSANLPVVIDTYLGDALWALMIYQFVAILLHKQKIMLIAGIAVTFCYLIEISQLYHAPWIDAIRNTRLGGLVLGFGFLWTDILAYSFGVAFGLITEKLIYYHILKTKLE